MKLNCIILLIFVLQLVESKVDTNQKDVRKKHNVGAEETIPKEQKDADTVNHRKTYIEEFKLRRREHKEAVTSIEAIEKDKLRVYLEEIRNNIKNILEEARSTLERISWKPRDPFPYDSELVLTSLSKVLENISFFAELSLAYPAHFEKALKKDRKLNTVVVWAYNYGKDTDLFDKDTVEVVDNMAKKFSIIPKDKNEKKTKMEIVEEARKAQERNKEEKSKDKKPSKKKKDDSKRIKGEL